MKNLKFKSLLIGMFMLLSTTGAHAGTLSGKCYVLVHGILGFDDTKGLLNGLVKYWGGMDNYLRSNGAKVATPASQAMADLHTRAVETRNYLNQWMPANGCSKVHLIGHSQGGLVSRYIVKNLGYSSKVASVTTVNSLHKGTPIADIALGIIPNWLEPFVGAVVNTFGKLIYRDGRPQDVIAMASSLTVSYVNNFNKSATNVSGVKYFSYGSYMEWADLIQHPLMALTHPATWAGGLFYGMGGKNDGVVPYSSQKWGTWKGSPSYSWWVTGIDHLQATNSAYSGQAFYDVQGYYLTMAKNAAGL